MWRHGDAAPGAALFSFFEVWSAPNSGASLTLMKEIKIFAGLILVTSAHLSCVQLCICPPTLWQILLSGLYVWFRAFWVQQEKGKQNLYSSGTYDWTPACCCTPLRVWQLFQLTSFYLTRSWLGDPLNQILFNEEKFRILCCTHH